MYDFLSLIESNFFNDKGSKRKSICQHYGKLSLKWW